MGSEAELLVMVKTWLKMHHIFWWRMPIGPVLHRRVQRGQMKTMWKKSPLKGFPDIAGVLQGDLKGVLFVLELKSKKGNMRKEQIDWLTALTKAGACYALVRSIGDLERAFEQWGEIKRRQPIPK